MKASLFSLLLLGCLGYSGQASAAATESEQPTEQRSVTFSTSGFIESSEDTSTQGVSNVGFMLSLSSDWLMISDSYNIDDLTQFSLTSVSMTLQKKADGTYNTSLTDCKLALHQGNSYFALSAIGIVDSEKGLLTFSFDDGVSLDLNTTYIFSFVSTPTSLNLAGSTVSGGSAVANTTNYLTNTQVSTTDTSSGLMNNLTAIQNNGTTKPNVQLTGLATVVVPEPATASLSLLALTGLLMRRKAL
jgi:hypothetical protein